METFFSELSLLMEKRGVTQQELSSMSGISQGTISKYRNNKQVPKSKELYAISKSLGVKMEYWFGEPSEIILNQNYSEWKDRAMNAERKLKKVNSSLGHLLECAKELQAAMQ